MNDKTITFNPDEISNMRLYLSLCGMYYEGRRAASNTSDLERRFVSEHLGNLKSLAAKFE